MAGVFISYDRRDHASAQKIYDTLFNRPDIEPWLDLQRLKLLPFDDEIRRVIENSSYFMALVSEASLSSSGYLATEWAYAQERNKRLLVVLLDQSLEGKAEADIPAIFKAILKVNWVRAYESFEEGMRKVMREVYSDLAGSTFRETFSSLGPDNHEWRFDGWVLDEADADHQNSESIVAEVAPSWGSQRQSRIATIPVSLGNWSRVAYARKLMLHRANTMATAQFQVTLSDGSHTFSIESVSLREAQLNYDEGWHHVEQPLDLTRFQRRKATLTFTLAASDMIAMPLTRGKAQVDNIRID